MTYDLKVCHASFTRVIETIEKSWRHCYGSSAAHFQVFQVFHHSKKSSEQYIPVVLFQKMLYTLVLHAFEWYHVNYYSFKIHHHFWLAPIPRQILFNQLALTIFLILLIPSLLLPVTKYTHIIVHEMLITIDPTLCRTNIKQFTILHLGPKLCVNQ